MQSRREQEPMRRRSGVARCVTGDWFAVPLADGSFAPGRVVVHGGDHVILGYVFAPVDHLPTLDEVATLDPGDALCACRMTGLQIGGRWPLLGGTGPVDRAEWRIPEGENDLRGILPPERAVRVDILNARLQTVHAFSVPASSLGQRQPGGVVKAEVLESWYLSAHARGTLVPVRTQQWWDHPTPVPGAIALVTPRPPELDDLVRVVVPGPDWAVAERLEGVLSRRLRSAVGEVDGTQSGPDSREIYAYGPDGHKLAAAVRRIVRTRRLPAGTHLMIESGDTAWRVPLTP